MLVFDGCNPSEEEKNEQKQLHPTAHVAKSQFEPEGLLHDHSAYKTNAKLDIYRGCYVAKVTNKHFSYQPMDKIVI